MRPLFIANQLVGHSNIWQRAFFRLYLLTLALIGLGYLAIMPVFEGFDENAHYSSIRQIADTGTIPVYGSSLLDKEASDYQAPLAYNSLNPPFDKEMVYRKFFTHPDLVESYLLTYRQPSLPSHYTSGEGLNWQAQHPPLYYILLSPLEKIAEHFSFVTRILILRIASFLLALAGVSLGILSITPVASHWKENPSVIGFALYPIILPMFFPEFTRIGNDSLCIFWVGAVVFILSKWVKNESKKTLSVSLGIVLGLGLLTKAFFLPITVALAVFLIVRVFRDSDALISRSERYRSLALIFLPALLIGSGWYVYKFMTYGELIGGDDAIKLAHQGGLLINLKENFSFYAVIRGFVATLVSYSWAGTWSLTRLPAVLHIPLLGLTVWIFGAYAFELKRRPFTDFAWLPVWLLTAFGIGLFYHVIVGVALKGNGNTPGWYLHILMPWVAPALGIGICSLLHNPRTRPFLIGLLLYAVLFQVMALWSQFALFTGCASKGDDKYYAFSGHLLCFDQASQMLERLSVVGWPILAAVGFGLGLICSLISLLVWINKEEVA